jgi:hypothetical protein
MQLRSNARHTYAIVNRPRQEEDRTSPGSNVGNIVAPVKTLLPNLNWITFQFSKRTSQKLFRARKPAKTGRLWTGLYQEASNVVAGARRGARLRMVGLIRNTR